MFGQRGDEHGDASSLPAISIDLTAILQRLFDQSEDSLAFIDMGEFAPSEPERELHPVAAKKKTPGAFDLDHEIVLVDLGGSDADFLQFGLVSMRLCLALLLGEIVLVLSVIEDSADWGGGGGYYLDEVESRFTGHCLGFAEGHDPGLFLVLIDQANW